jgi:hemerythrin-like domain-containing protein
METMLWTATLVAVFVIALFLFYRVGAARDLRLMRCPETGGTAVVHADGFGHGTATGGGVTVRSCDLWPARAGCGRGCLERYAETTPGWGISIEALRPFTSRKREPAAVQGPRALALLRDEHRSILTVVHGLDYFVQGIRTLGKRVEPRVFHAMLYYLDAFSARIHHPKEDRYLFPALRERSADAATLIADLEEEHVRGDDALRGLAQAFLRYEEGGAAEFPAFEREVENFARNYRDHVRKEEELLFPLAQKVLTAADWAKLDIAIRKDRDPLQLGGDPGDFDRLFERIQSIAPPPIGLGAAPVPG